MAQSPVIASFGHNGELVCTNLEPGTTAVVEWASSPDGPWTSTWAGLASVVPDSSGAIRVTVPIYYRVMGVPLDPGQTNFAWIPAGTFTMGSPETEAERWSETQHAVTVSRGFWMGKYEVTQGEYLEVVGSNPSFWRNGATGETFEGTGGPVTNELRHPVEQVSWRDITNYCAQLTERERAAGRLPHGYLYRLPTEAQWEYACRSGTTTSHHYGRELRSGMANFDGRSEYDASIGIIPNPEGIYLGRTREVGSYAPNAWGLYDMHGNVWELCQDGYVEGYPVRPVVDPTGPVTGTGQGIRGGSWYNRACYCRCAFRLGVDPEFWDLGNGGFRMALVAVP